MAFSPELEEYIQAAIVDGEISEKERKVLHKKAIQEGLDPEDIDVVIDGRLQKMQKDKLAQKQKVVRCPACGDIVPAMTAVCPSCGQVIDTSVPDNKALKVFMTHLEKAIADYTKFQSKRSDLETMIRQGRALYGDNQKISSIINEIESNMIRIGEQHKKRKNIKLIAFFVIIIIIISCCIAFI